MINDCGIIKYLSKIVKYRFMPDVNSLKQLAYAVCALKKKLLVTLIAIKADTEIEDIIDYEN